MVSTVISKIISMQPNFTVSENAISQYVIGHAEQDVYKRQVLAPSAEEDDSQDEINKLDNRILSCQDNVAAWQCETFKNLSTLHPQTLSLIHISFVILMQ